MPEVAAVVETRVDPRDWATHVTLTEARRLVVGGPGAGKTEFLVRTVAAAVTAGAVAADEVLFLTFSRRGVTDVRTRLRALLGTRAARVTVSTHHGWAMRIVEANHAKLGWERTPSVLTGAEQEALVADLLATEDPDSWPLPQRQILATEAMASDVTDFILRAHEQQVQPRDVAARGRADWVALPAFVDRYHDALRTRSLIDYGLLVSEAHRLVTEHPDLAPSHGLVVADEYQDMAPVQARLVVELGARAAHFVVAGDPYQSIYSFRGADYTNVFTFPDDVAAAGSPEVERLILTTSFRVPEAILAAAVSVTARELPGGAGKVLSTRRGGSVACHEFATVGAEAEWIASDIERIHLTDGVPLHRVAVFVRTHGPFVDDLARALDRRRIDHSYTDERLGDEPAVRFVHDLVRATRTDDGAEPALRRVLLGPCIGMPPGALSTLPGAGASVAERAAWLEARGGPEAAVADLLVDTSWCDEVPAAAGLWRVWTTIPQLADIATSPDRVRDRRAWSAYAQVVDRIAERSAATTLADLTDLATRVAFEADPLFSVEDIGGVTITTLHRSKGTEFDAVYIADAVEGRLPDLRSRDSLLGARHLNPKLPTATADYVTFRLDEERRLAYTAMTRSTARVVWTATIASDQGSGTAPSRFMRLVAATTPPAGDDRPLTPRALLALARRTVADTDAPPVERLAALRLLADPMAADGDALDRYGVRRRGEATGFVRARAGTSRIRLTPTDAVAYDRCPRRHAVERYLLTRRQDSPYSLLGNLVHDVLEAAEREAMADGLDHATIADARRWLDHFWPDAGFGTDAVADAWRRRAAAILERLYDRWPTDGTPVALEHVLEHEIADATWSGRADRIEANGGSLSIVDYKTSTTIPTKADAAASLQLGYYVLAAAADPALGAIGPISGAAFWYPAGEGPGGSIAVRAFDTTNLEPVRTRLGEITEAVRAEDFPPKPNRDCGRCPVSATCPGVPAGAEAFA